MCIYLVVAKISTVFLWREAMCVKVSYKQCQQKHWNLPQIFVASIFLWLLKARCLWRRYDNILAISLPVTFPKRFDRNWGWIEDIIFFKINTNKRNTGSGQFRCWTSEGERQKRIMDRFQHRAIAQHKVNIPSDWKVQTTAVRRKMAAYCSFQWARAELTKSPLNTVLILEQPWPKLPQAFQLQF